jgi:hypothetical protein
MSDRPQSDDWWLASDGNWYPPQSRPLPAPPAPPAPPLQLAAFTLSSGITTAVRIFMFITVGLALCAGVAYANVVVRFGAWWTAPAAGDWDELAHWESAEEIASGFLGVMYLGGLGKPGLPQHRALRPHRAFVVSRLGGGRLVHSTGQCGHPQTGAQRSGAGVGPGERAAARGVSVAAGQDRRGRQLVVDPLCGVAGRGQRRLDLHWSRRQWDLLMGFRCRGLSGRARHRDGRAGWARGGSDLWAHYCKRLGDRLSGWPGRGAAR